jgi:hypothetical protein
MKKFQIIIQFLSILVLQINLSIAQPVWHKTIGLANEPGSKLSAIKVLVDFTSQIYVLSNYQNPVGVANPARKIYLTKYDENGTHLWTYIYDNSGNNNVRAFDMCIDASNNIYVAGGRMDSLPNVVMLYKVTSAGNFDWEKYGNSAFTTDWYNKITFRNNLFYARGTAGVAVYDQNGNEQYALSQYNTAFDVDYSGRIVLAAYTSFNSIIRYTNTGTIELTDSTIMADKILIDYNNEIFVSSGQMGMQPYQLVKHDSNGQYQWSITGLPITPPFGDFSYGLMDTGQNEYILYGVSDTIIKFNNQGQIIWKKNMGGMDDYIISGKILGNGFILLTGTISGFAGSDVNTKIFNINGDEIWGQLYSGLFTGNEFGVDVDVDYSGIYVISQLDDSTNVMKYLNPGSGNNVDFGLVCVDSAWIDSTGMVQINIFNGNFVHMNYPAVTILSPAGDTISEGNINFFAQLGNSYQIYQNSISDTTITDFSNYTFLMQNAFNPDTLVQIEFCISTALIDSKKLDYIIFPNPVSNLLHIQFNDMNIAEELQVWNIYGQLVQSHKNLNKQNQISCDGLSDGIYILKMLQGNKVQLNKFIVAH